MWTEITRAKYRRDELPYASATRDAEWAHIAPLLPARRRLGRPREWELREIVDALLYILWTGCPWRGLPREFPPRSTVQGYFYRWRDEGIWARVNAALVASGRRRLGRASAPSLAIIDSQSVPTGESGGPRGFDAGKRIKGRKRHIITDTQGFVLALQVHAADIQDPHGAVPLLHELRRRELSCRALGVTSYTDRMPAAIRAGARGYLSKDVDPVALVAAVRSVAAGHLLLEPAAVEALMATPADGSTLTARERDVLLLLAEGRSNREIARALAVAEKTVKTHVSSILLKLGLADRTQAAVYAVRSGLTDH